MLPNTKTDENLKTAYVGECRSRQAYLLFADKAFQEGHQQIARLFRATAVTESVHARRHSEAMSDTVRLAAEAEAVEGTTVNVRSTEENLVEAIIGEIYEFAKKSPSFISQAEQDENIRAQMAFFHANAVKQIHHGLFEAALKALKINRPLKDEPYFVGEICGYIAARVAPEQCPICGTMQNRFTKVE